MSWAVGLESWIGHSFSMHKACRPGSTLPLNVHSIACVTRVAERHRKVCSQSHQVGRCLTAGERYDRRREGRRVRSFDDIGPERTGLLVEYMSTRAD